VGQGAETEPPLQGFLWLTLKTTAWYMSLNTSEGEMRKTRITGTVTLKRIASQSKSDHVGVVLRADDGKEYVLRRKGGNAFQDDQLEKLVGETITGVGLLANRTFILDGWSLKKSS
jgi:hypothetical protein